MAANPALHEYERRLLRISPVRLDVNERGTVLTAIREVCRHERWTLHAAHVRSNHVHVVAAADCDPDLIMAKFKAYAISPRPLRAP